MRAWRFVGRTISDNSVIAETPVTSRLDARLLAAGENEALR